MGINVEAKIDVSDSANEIVKQTFSEPAKEGSKALKTIIGFFNNTVLYPLQQYNLYAESKLREYAKQLENKVTNIPEAEIVEPSVNILGPAMEGLKYNLDEEHIKEMFLNILSSDMNKGKKSLVLPAYIEMIKQISNEDAKFLNSLYEIYDKTKSNMIPLLYVILMNPVNSNGYVLLDKYIIPELNHTILVNQVVLDNLIRLGIVECIEGKAIMGSQLYLHGFDLVRNKYNKMPDTIGKVSYESGIMKISDFGLNFLKVCIDSK